ncbi:MAG: hypothetical protein AAF743_11115, partial [Planctomycetota bacterium]
AISFEANDATVTIPDIVTAQADTIAFNLDPDDTSTDAILASFTGVNIGLDALPELPIDSLTVDELLLRRNGFDLDVSVDDLDFDLAGLFAVEGLNVDVDLQVRLDNADSFVDAFTIDGSVEIETDSATLLPNGVVSLTTTGLEGAIDLEEATLQLTAETLAGGLTIDGETLFSLNADPVGMIPALSFVLDRSLGDDELVLGLPTLTGTFDALAVDGVAPVVNVNGFGVQADGGIELDAFDITLPAGFLNKSLGLGGVLPAEFAALTADFADLPDGSVDFDTLRINATVKVDTAGFETQLGTLLGAAPVVAVRRYDTAGMLTDLSDGGEINATLDVLNGVPRLIDVPGLQAEIENLVLPVAAGRSVTVDGTLTLPALDASGNVVDIPAALVPSALVGTPPQAVLDVSAEADVGAGALGGSFVIGGSVDVSNDVTTLALAGQAVLEGDLSFLGGDASGSTTADFDWTLTATPEPDGTLTLDGTPRLTGVLFENILFEVDGLLRLAVPSAELDFDDPPDGAVARADGATLQILVDGFEGVGGTIGNVVLFDDNGDDVLDGFAISNVTLGNDGTLNLGDGLLTLTDTVLSIPSIVFRDGVLSSGLPDIDITAAEVALALPGVSVSAEELALSISPDERVLTVMVGLLTLGVGDAFEGGGSLFTIELADAALRLDENDATDLLTVANAKLGFGPDAAPLDALSFSLANFRLNLVNGETRLGLDSASFDATGGVLASLGLGGVLPLDIDAASLDFTETDADGYTDFTAFDFEVEGSFDFGVFGALPFTPT